MTKATTILILSAFTVGIVHTLLGPDHYIPFIALAKARKWSLTKTSLITSLCGAGHVLSAAVIGFIGVSIGLTAARLNFLETYRGEIAAWFLIVFRFAVFDLEYTSLVSRTANIHISMCMKMGKSTNIHMTIIPDMCMFI